MSAYRLGAAVAMAALLAACGQSSFIPRGAASSDQQSAPAQAGDEAPDPDANLVNAVGPPGSNNLVSVKFRIEARPVVGTPVKVEVVLIPAANVQINHIHGSFLAGPGLMLQSERTFDLPAVQAGASLQREVTLVPQQTGVLNLNATILIEQDTGSQARTYSIPLIATDSST